MAISLTTTPTTNATSNAANGQQLLAAMRLASSALNQLREMGFSRADIKQFACDALNA